KNFAKIQLEIMDLTLFHPITEEHHYLILTKIMYLYEYRKIGCDWYFLKSNSLLIPFLCRTISRLTQLERLDLGSNEFTEVPEVLEQLSGLKEFWMDGNRLTLIPGFIGTLKQLTYLDISKNNIEVVEEGISGCESLQDLLLSSNSLQQLPESIGFLKKVTTLKIDENQLICLPDSIGGLLSVEELDCSFNEIVTLPSSVGQLSNIRTFAADHNFLRQLPSEIGNWKHLTVLFLHSNKLEFLPEEMGDMQKLKVINLSDNRLKNLPFTFTKLQQLTAMWLSDNQSKPLIPLQKEADPDTQKTVLTNYMFPQQPRTEDVMFISDNESFNPSLWDEQRKQRAQVAFECDEDKDEREAPPREGNLKRYPTPYPDELKNMVKTVQTIVHRLKDEESTEDVPKESKQEGQTVSVKDVGVKTSEIASIKKKANVRKQYSAGSSVQKPTEPEAVHSTANSQMTALDKTLQNVKTIVHHEDTLKESEELSSDEEMKMAEMRPPLIETSISQPKVVALSNNRKDNSKDDDSLSDEAIHNSNQNNSNCSSPSQLSDSVSLNTDSSQDISLCSPDKEIHAAVLSKIRSEDENLDNLLQNGGELSITVEEKINVKVKVTNLSEYELSIEERLGLIRKGVDLSTPVEESHKSDQISMNVNKLVSREGVPVPVERLQTQEIVSVKGFLNSNMKEESKYLENGNKYPINKVNGHPEEAVQSPSKGELMRSSVVNGDTSVELSVSRSTEDLSPQRSGPVMKSHSITSMDTGLKIYNIVNENGSQQPNSVVKSASGSADGKIIVQSKSATLLYDQPLHIFPRPLLSSDLVSSTKSVFKFDSNHNPEVRGSVTSGAQMFCTPQYNIQYSSSATMKDTLQPQKQNTQVEQGSLPPSHLLRSDSTEIASYVRHSANMNLSNLNNIRASTVYNTQQQMAGRYIDAWAITPNDGLLSGVTRHTLQRQSSVSSTASINVGDIGPSRQAQVPEGDYLIYRDLHSVGRALPVMSGQQRPLSARTYNIDGPNVPRPQSAQPLVNEIPERTMSVSDFNYSWTRPSKRSNPRVNSDHSLLDPSGKSKVPHDWREQVLQHIEAKKLEKSMLSRSFNSNYAAVSSFHYGSSRDLHGSQGSVALSVADRRGSGVHIVRVPLTNGQMCQPQRPQANYSQVHHLPPPSSVARHPSREQLIDYLMLKVAHHHPYTQSQCSPRQSHELAKQEIRVRIDKDTELGFSISGGVGGRGNPFRPEDDGIFVTRVQPEGPASKLLQPGDKIIQANGCSFINIDHGQAVSLLKTFQDVVELIVVREVSS
uniref:PDZ domain-containing protein n=1 Tax=Otus sunia TaxID=257818 RepID=A0A8C8A4P2_9STRI